MHIVIIGGGAAGMATAHYLAMQHRVTLLEKEAVPGGNICTLNRNADAPGLPASVHLDNGVIEFHQDHSPSFSSLIKELGLLLEPVAGGSTSIHLLNGECVHMPGVIREKSSSAAESIRLYSRLMWALRFLGPIVLRMNRSRRRENDSVGSFLGTDILSRWIRMLLMYGYSIPYGQIDDFPARHAIPTLLQGFIGTKWVRLKGGTYSYIAEIINQAGSSLKLELGQSIDSVRRNPNGVSVECTAGTIDADKVVFAVPPDQILGMLADPDEDELGWFSPWQANFATTTIHTDEGIYSDWANSTFSEFDVFEKEGGDAGYNAYLNRLSGESGNSEVNYFLAYNMDEHIDPDKVLHVRRHHTPLYTAEAARSIPEIQARNGSNRTYHAGAYLYNGLHEGAIESALAVRTRCAR